MRKSQLQGRFTRGFQVPGISQRSVKDVQIFTVLTSYVLQTAVSQCVYITMATTVTQKHSTADSKYPFNIADLKSTSALNLCTSHMIKDDHRIVPACIVYITASKKSAPPSVWEGDKDRSIHVI